MAGEAQLVNYDGLRKMLGLDDLSMKRLMRNNPPHLNVHDRIWFEFNDEFLLWMKEHYQVGGPSADTEE